MYSTIFVCLHTYMCVCLCASTVQYAQCITYTYRLSVSLSFNRYKLSLQLLAMTRSKWERERKKKNRETNLHANQHWLLMFCERYVQWQNYLFKNTFHSFLPLLSPHTHTQHSWMLVIDKVLILKQSHAFFQRTSVHTLLSFANGRE